MQEIESRAREVCTMGHGSALPLELKTLSGDRTFISGPVLERGRPVFMQFPILHAMSIIPADLVGVEYPEDARYYSPDNPVVKAYWYAFQAVCCTPNSLDWMNPRTRPYSISYLKELQAQYFPSAEPIEELITEEGIRKLRNAIEYYYPHTIYYLREAMVPGNHNEDGEFVGNKRGPRRQTYLSHRRQVSPNDFSQSNQLTLPPYANCYPLPQLPLHRFVYESVGTHRNLV